MTLKHNMGYDYDMVQRQIAALSQSLCSGAAAVDAAAAAAAAAIGCISAVKRESTAAAVL
jgi:hypothetical protein